MIVPDFYKQFHCLAGDCKKSCCIGWELDLDDETWDTYRHLPGEFGKRVREAEEDVEEDGEIFHTFPLKNGRCPMLNDEGLCDICLNVGEEALSVVCTEYPRYSLGFCGRVERSLSLSCEEVGRLFFEKKEPLTFVAAEDEPGAEAYLDDEPYDDDEGMMPEEIREIRDSLMAVFRQEKHTFVECMREAICLAVDNYDRIEGDYPDNSAEDFIADCFAERLAALDEMEVLNDDWQNTLDALHALEDSYPGNVDSAALMSDLQWKNLAIYLIERYVPRAVYDGDIIGKMKFVFFFLMVLRDMALLKHRETEEALTLDDKIELTQILSRQIEHSEDNIDIIMEELLFNEGSSPASMLRTLACM